MTRSKSRFGEGFVCVLFKHPVFNDETRLRAKRLASPLSPPPPTTRTYIPTYTCIVCCHLSFSNQDNAGAATAQTRIVTNCSNERHQPSPCAAVVLSCEQTRSSVQSRSTVHCPGRRGGALDVFPFVYGNSVCVFCSLL